MIGINFAKDKHAARAQAYYWKPYFWSRSYRILTTGGAPIEVIKEYIENQGKEETPNPTIS
ncbi:transposase [Halalkalibacter kiskunsagensis]|uniref:Transposase n=1 Tax=Halalkalibacter kiskunsagensis TaxID=1548599 RepID=A0ABV6KB29_9BACI